MLRCAAMCWPGLAAYLVVFIPFLLAVLLSATETRTLVFQPQEAKRRVAGGRRHLVIIKIFLLTVFFVFLTVFFIIWSTNSAERSVALSAKWARAT